MEAASTAARYAEGPDGGVPTSAEIWSAAAAASPSLAHHVPSEYLDNVASLLVGETPASAHAAPGLRLLVLSPSAPFFLDTLASLDATATDADAAWPYVLLLPPDLRARFPTLAAAAPSDPLARAEARIAAVLKMKLPMREVELLERAVKMEAPPDMLAADMATSSARYKRKLKNGQLIELLLARAINYYADVQTSRQRLRDDLPDDWPLKAALTKAHPDSLAAAVGYACARAAKLR